MGMNTLQNPCFDTTDVSGCIHEDACNFVCCYAKASSSQKPHRHVRQEGGACRVDDEPHAMQKPELGRARA